MLTFVGPLYVFEPETTNSPAPFIANPPLPPIAPEIVRHIAAAGRGHAGVVLKLMGAEIVWLPVTLIVATPPPPLSVKRAAAALGQGVAAAAGRS